MAVYTQLSAQVLTELIAQYDVGELISAKGIAEGVSNSNWLVETTQNRFILTMYERRIENEDLPYFLGLLDHLSAKNCPVPRTIHDREGKSFRMLGDKAVALIEFLPGVSVDQPTPQQARNVGIVLAQMHLAAQDYAGSRSNDLGPDISASVLAQCGKKALGSINPALGAMIERASDVAENWPRGLPNSIIHSDLFPDNVLILGDKVSGLIDFYFACNDAMAYDLAVTHAAWSFSADGATYRADIGAALFSGYQSVRPLEEAERAALPLLAQGAALRFISSRAQDILDETIEDSPNVKDPMDFVRRLEFYALDGKDAFAEACS